MSQPITWRSITAPDYTGAMKGMESASKLLDTAFARAGSTLKDYEAGVQRIAEREEQGKLLAYQEFMNSLKTPEDIEANQDTIAAMRAGLDQEGRLKTLNSLNERTAAAQKEVIEGRTYRDNEFAFRNRELFNTVKAKALAGDAAGALADLETVRADNPNHAAMVAEVEKLRSQFVEEQQKNLQFGYTIADLANKQQLAPLEKERIETGIASNKASTEDARLRMVQTLQERATKALANLATFDAETVGSQEGQKFVADQIKLAVSDPGRAAELTTNVNRLLADPKYRNIPVTQVVNMALGTSKGGWFSSAGDDLKVKADAYMQTPEFAAYTKAREVQRDSLTNTANISQALADQRWQSVFGNEVPRPGSSKEQPDPVTVNRETAQKDQKETTSTNKQTQATTSADQTWKEEFALERDEIQAGLRKDYSPEIKKALDQETRTAVTNSILGAGDAASQFNRAALDVFTLPARGVIGAIRDVGGVARAAGASFLPEVTPNPLYDSMTPYMDEYRRNRMAASLKADLKKRREALEAKKTEK